LFFRCSGLMEGELDCEKGARVGVELVEGGAMLDGSKSRSGSGGHIPGLRVILKIISRRMAFTSSSKKTPRQRFLFETFLRNPISITSSRNLITSKVRAAHLYLEFLSDHPRVKRECCEGGINGLNLGSDRITRERTESWYRLVRLRNAERASEARSASLNRPGKNHVNERKEDSTVDIVDALLSKKFS